MIPVKPHIAERAWTKSLAEYHEMYRRSIEEPEAFWREMSQAIDWFHPPRGIMDADPEEVDSSWYSSARSSRSPPGGQSRRRSTLPKGMA